jgi:lysyl-tRNA synthetase class 2
MENLKGREKQIIGERIKKVEELRANGVNPYPYSFNKTHSTTKITQNYDKLKNEETHKDTVSTAGRIVAKRSFGKIMFGTIQDDKGKIQVVLQDGITEKSQMDLFKKVDAGDFIGIFGNPMRTVRGELSIIVKEVTILTKSIKPLPEKFHGIKDKEERYRKRYLDLIVNPEVKDVFAKRSKIIKSIRETLSGKDFDEVDTPYLQTVYGGADAEPFTTHLNALKLDIFLAISPELYLKRLLVGGFERVFTIARNFRNEGVDRSHNPEFTMMEIYQAYGDYNDMMDLTEEIFENACFAANGTNKVDYQGTELSFARPWAKMTMAEAIKKYGNIDVENSTEEELSKIIKENNIEAKGTSWGYLTMALFDHYCEENIVQPTFITDHPKESTPLCKPLRNDPTGRLIERFEPFCAGMEIANAYSELNDPKLQRELLQAQQDRLTSGEDKEAHPFDEDFINAIEVGMPPAGGLGIGIDRMIMLLTNQHSIRDVIFFPFMKPEITKTDEKEKKKGKKKKQ